VSLDKAKPKKECPVCKKRGKPCTRFVSAAHVFKHYCVPIKRRFLRESDR
jgi:hypothetical protein